ncbi:MAG: hypothetical protein ACI4OJ_03030 [Lachnospiraceae bacterium]
MKNEEKMAVSLAGKLVSEFNLEEIRAFLASRPLGVEVVNGFIGIHRLDGEEHVVVEVPEMGALDIDPFLLQAGMPEEQEEALRLHPDRIRATQMRSKERCTMVVTLYPGSGESLERVHVRNVLTQLLEMSGCCDLEVLRNEILDAAEAANLPPGFPFLF